METRTYYIRAAEASDQASIRALIRRVRINPLNLNWQNFHVAVNTNDLMIGCGQIKAHRDGTQEMASIAVEVEWRGRGIGSEIILALLDTSQAPLWLVCRSEMGSYYEQFGFRIVEDIDKLPRAYRRMRGMSRLVSRVFPNADDFHIMILDQVR